MGLELGWLGDVGGKEDEGVEEQRNKGKNEDEEAGKEGKERWSGAIV